MRIRIPIPAVTGDFPWPLVIALLLLVALVVTLDLAARQHPSPGVPMTPQIVPVAAIPVTGPSVLAPPPIAPLPMPPAAKPVPSTVPPTDPQPPAIHQADPPTESTCPQRRGILGRRRG